MSHRAGLGSVTVITTASDRRTAVHMPNKVIEVGAWCLENGHRALLKVSGGRFPKTMLGMQPVELFTVGRVSGERRATMLTAPIFEPDRVVLVASKGGHEDHPGWYKNLVKEPKVEIGRASCRERVCSVV